MNTQDATPSATFSPFLPVTLLALSMLIFLGWQTTEAVRQHSNLIRLADRQELLAGQAAQTETQLQSLMMDLLELSKSDEDARAIAAKYNIKFNPPPAVPGEPEPTAEGEDLLRASKATVTAPPAPEKGPAAGSGSVVTEP